MASCMAASCSSRCGFPSFLLVYRGHRTAENAACRRESSKTEETVICQESRRVRLSRSPASERLRVSSWAGSAPLPVACGSSLPLGSCAVRLGSQGATVPGRPLSRNNISQEQEGRCAQSQAGPSPPRLPARHFPQGLIHTQNITEGK